MINISGFHLTGSVPAGRISYRQQPASWSAAMCVASICRAIDCSGAGKTPAHGMYGKQTKTAIAAMSRLAEVYDEGRTPLSASDIADARGLPQPNVAKVLSTLSKAGLVIGSPGPGGGFVLGRHPKDIAIFDVFVLFERQDDSRNCPFGGGICGSGTNCPIHDDLVAVHLATEQLLHEVTFERFRVAVQEDGWRPKGVGTRRAAAKRR